VLLYNAGLFVLGLLQRFLAPALGGITIISGPLVIAMIILPALMAALVLYERRATIKPSGVAMMVVPAAINTAFGIYLLAWSLS
jgi:hypothetical protein